MRPAGLPVVNQVSGFFFTGRFQPSTVTQDVPPLSLALSRAPQVIKEGWVIRKKGGKG